MKKECQGYMAACELGTCDHVKALPMPGAAHTMPNCPGGNMCGCYAYQLQQGWLKNECPECLAQPGDACVGRLIHRKRRTAGPSSGPATGADYAARALVRSELSFGMYQTIGVMRKYAERSLEAAKVRLRAIDAVEAERK